MNGFTPFFAGMMLSFAVLFVQGASNAAVSQIKIAGEHRTLQGWISQTAGV